MKGRNTSHLLTLFIAKGYHMEMNLQEEIYCDFVRLAEPHVTPLQLKARVYSYRRLYSEESIAKLKACRKARYALHGEEIRKKSREYYDHNRDNPEFYIRKRKASSLHRLKLLEDPVKLAACREDSRRRAKIASKHNIKNVSDTYVRSLLRERTNLNEIPQSLVEVKAIQLKLKRLIWNRK